jgi:hypothetical protein
MKNRKVRVKEKDFCGFLAVLKSKSEGRWEKMNDLSDETRSECLGRENWREIWLGRG